MQKHYENRGFLHIFSIMPHDKNWAWKPTGISFKPTSRKEHRKQKHSPRFRDPFFLSREWLELRYAVLKKHGAQCQCCGATRLDGAVLNVDHIKPRSKFPELALCEDNLQVLCARCNRGKGAWDETDWRSLDEDARQHMRDILAS